ncbi:MAG: hypothetical protein AB1700_13755, partial [Bacillota bacterium]
MKKSLGIVLAVLLVAVLSVPAMGATLSVSGKYVGQIVYDGGLVYSKNPYAFQTIEGESVLRAEYKAVDLLRMSTLYLNIDFAEGELMSAHIPLRLYKAIELEVDQNPDDNYLFVFKGAPLVLSLTDAKSGDYAFASFGDPLGLVKSIGDDSRATFKAAGKPFGLGFTSYYIAMNPTGAVNPRYALGRVTYGLSSGHTLGAVYAAKEADGNMTVNVEGDVTGPLPICEGATFTAALALSKTLTSSGWSTPVNAFELNLGGIKAGNFTLSGNVRAVDPTFAIVAKGPSDAKSDAESFLGRRQLQGEAVTNVNIAGQAVKLTIGDDYRVAYDGALDNKAYNKFYGSGEFSPSQPVTVTVGGYYQDWLTTSGHVSDDYKKNIYGKVKYAPAENLTVNAGAQWMIADLYDPGSAGPPAVPAVEREGSGFKLDGSVEVKPAAGVLVKGSAAYQSGKYDFIGKDNLVDANQTRLDAEAYAEAKQTFVAAGVKQVDTVLAGLTRGIKLSSPDVKTTYVGYAEANFVISDLFSDKIALLSGKSTEVSHYGTIVHNKFTYTLSSNST